MKWNLATAKFIGCLPFSSDHWQQCCVASGSWLTQNSSSGEAMLLDIILCDSEDDQTNFVKRMDKQLCHIGKCTFI